MAKTLYLRNVPDEVAERLDRLARQEGMSTSAFSVRELTLVARRADNAAILASLPSIPFSAEDVVAGIHADRDERASHLESVAADGAAERRPRAR